MSDIVIRLRFDAARCEAGFSKGVARNIDEGADEIERLRRDLEIAQQIIRDIGLRDREFAQRNTE